MLTAVRSVGIYVGDQDRAKEFFTGTLGFELVQDTPMGEEPGTARWIEVAPPDRNVILVLYTPEGDQERVGTFSNVLFECDDIQATHKQLAARGVEFAEEPSRQFWGWWAVFKDPDGNSYGLGQRGG
ncbi:MAG TPA: VOC family protein [Actinomycetota bacterium]|jgi:catechol 2,3-dioxygenase-like lactoylglutathione lyase family enzyme|nr:VOC family protein [Actinomycetota bacterium]